MAFDRRVELLITRPVTGLGPTTALLVSDLDIDFDVERSVVWANNTAQFKIYNAAADTRSTLAAKGANVTFKAGYADEALGVIFIGNVIDTITEKDGVNWVTTISAASIFSNKVALERKSVALSFGANASMQSVLEEIAATVQIVPYGLENLAGLTLPNGFVSAGTIQSVLRYCQTILKGKDLGLYIDNTELIVYRLGQRDGRYATVFLDYDSGLLNVKEVLDTEAFTKTPLLNKKRIQFESILLPTLQPNATMTISTPNIKGTYIVEFLKFTGNNYGGDFRTTGEAVA